MSLFHCLKTIIIGSMVVAICPASANRELANHLHDDFLEQSIQFKLMNPHRRFVDQSALFKIDPQRNFLLAQVDDLDIDFGEYGEEEALEEFEEEYQEEIEALEQTEPEIIEPVEEIVEQEPLVGPEEVTTSTTEEEVFADDTSEIIIDDEQETILEEAPTNEVVDDGTIFIDPTEETAPIEFEEELVDEADELIEEIPEEVADDETSPEILEVDDVEVIGEPFKLITPLPGVDFDEDQISTNIQTATGEDIKKSGAINATQFLNEQLQSITVSDNSGNPFQQDVNFRGFSASPLIATPQGLSIYIDGVRVNESFGDVVNWDLIPLNAIDSVALVPGATPLFGLNTIAGALTLSTKTGFSSPGVDAAARYGSWNRRQRELTIGGNNGLVGAFVAYNRVQEDGWRNNSPSDVEQIFGRADVTTDMLNLSFSGLAADNSLVGNGTVPFSDFEIDPEQIYTSPDITNNSVNHFNMTATLTPNDNTSISALAYHRGVNQTTIGGDFWDDFERAVDGRLGYFCDRFAAPGQPANGAGTGDPGVPGCYPNGVLNQGGLEQDTYGASLQLNWVTERNQAVFGATFDKYNVEFSQSQLLGFIESDRSVVADPTRLVGANLIGAPFFDDPQVFINLCVLSGQTLATCQELSRQDELGRINFAAENPILRNRVKGVGTNAAFFLYDAFNVTPKLTTTLGLRYNRTRVQNQVQADAPTPLWTFDRATFENTILQCRLDPTDLVSRLQCTSEDIVFKSWNPALGITYALNESTSTFANVSVGTRTPSAIELACARPADEDIQQGLIVGCTIPTNFTADPPLEQVRSTSYEIGTRMQFNNGIDANLAFFRTDLKNDILFLSLGRGNRGVFDNFGETRRQGLELGLSGDHGRFNWFLNYTYLKATFESEATVVNSSNSTAARGFNAINEFTVDIGDEIPGVPNHAIRAGVEFAFTPKFSLGLNLIAQSDSFARGNENNEHQAVGNDEFSNGQSSSGPCAPNIQLPGGACFEGGRPFIGSGSIKAFWILNLDATYRPTKRLTVSLAVDNLFDKRFATAGNLGFSPFQSDSVNFPGAVDAAGFNFNSFNWKHDLFVGPGAPRAAWLSLRYTWDGW